MPMEPAASPTPMRSARVSTRLAGSTLAMRCGQISASPSAAMPMSEASGSRARRPIAATAAESHRGRRLADRPRGHRKEVWMLAFTFNGNGAAVPGSASSDFRSAALLIKAYLVDQFARLLAQLCNLGDRQVVGLERT